MSAVYEVEIERRRTADGRELYSVVVGFVDRPQHASKCDGTPLIHRPADTRDEAVETAREILADYREHERRRGDRPAPVADNTELRDETGEFGMEEFFDCGTLAAYMGGAS